MPVGAMVFQRVTLAGLVVNLAAVPCMAVVQIAAMVTVAADGARLEPVAAASGWVAQLFAAGLVGSAGLVDLAPWLMWRIPPPQPLLVAGYYAALAAWLRTRTRPALAAAIALFVCIAVAPPTLARVHGDGRLHLTMMDVGQGDAMLVTLPNGRTLMIDAGGVSTRGDFDIGDRVVGPALRARRIGRLDYLAFTHGDPDHIGGAGALTRDFSPLEVWQGTPVPAHQAAQALREVAAVERSAWRTLQRGDRVEFGGVELRVHHPAPPEWERQKVRNNDSLVLELRFGQVSMLLTGDIEGEGEDAIVAGLDLLPVVVLKAPHHGSGTSSSERFLAAVKPNIVLISCGRGNPYGHPVPYVLERYRAMTAEIFRTDQDGQIEVITDGQGLTVDTFTGRHLSVAR
jgi:competence protein ComEC